LLQIIPFYSFMSFVEKGALYIVELCFQHQFLRRGLFDAPYLLKIAYNVMLDLENIHPQPYLFLPSVYSLLNQHHTLGNKELNKMEFSYLIVQQPFAELMLHPDKFFDNNVRNIAIIHILLEYEKLYPYYIPQHKMHYQHLL